MDGIENRKEEQELLRMLREDPAAGLAQALESYGGAAKTICVSILGTGFQQDVEECISDCFVKLWQGIDNFDPEKGKSLRGYFYGLVRNTALSKRRQLIRDNNLIPIEENVLEVERAGHRSGEREDLSGQLAEQMERETVQKTVEELPPPDREIFIYRYFFYEPVKEIARKLNLSAKQVENRLARGKQRLRERLAEGGIVR